MKTKTQKAYELGVIAGRVFVKLCELVMLLSIIFDAFDNSFSQRTGILLGILLLGILLDIKIAIQHVKPEVNIKTEKLTMKVNEASKHE